MTDLDRYRRRHAECGPDCIETFDACPPPPAPAPDETLDLIAAALWPAPDAQWTPETLDTVARILIGAGYGPAPAPDHEPDHEPGRPAPCEACAGTGRRPTRATRTRAAGERPCAGCQGTGAAPDPRPSDTTGARLDTTGGEA